MNVFRAANPEVMDILREQGVTLEDPSINSEVFDRAMKDLMRKEPDGILVLVGVEEDEIKAYLIADSAPDYNHVFVYHAWSDVGNPSSVTERMFHMLSEWAEVLGKREIRMETSRDPRGFARRWGFEEFSTIMKYELQTEPEDAQVESETGEHADGQSAAGDGSDGELPVESDRAGAAGVSGGESRGADAGDAAGEESPWEIEPLDPLAPAAERSF